MTTSARTDYHFAKLMIAECDSFAARESTPAFLAIWTLAVARAKANRHAEFNEGELIMLLGKKKSRDVDNAIARAVECGLLESTSMPTCLVVTNLVTIAGRKLVCRTHGDGAPPPVLATKCRHGERRNYAQNRCESCYRMEKRRAKREGREPDW